MILSPEGTADVAAVVEIIGLNLVLSGDNALVIALVTRGLPTAERRTGILVGTAGALVMRVLLTLGIGRLLELPGLRLGGGVMLIWMGWRMVQPKVELGSRVVKARTLAAAVRDVIWADVVMSADNVLAVAAAAHGKTVLLMIGILTSIPIVALGSGLIGRLLDRFPVLLAVGAGLLGWVGGDLVVADALAQPLAAWARELFAPLVALVLFWLGWRSWRRDALTASQHAPPPGL